MAACNNENFKQLADAISRIEKYIGTTINPEKNTITWELREIKKELENLSYLQRSFKFKSESPEAKYVIEHNLNTFFLNVNVLGQRDGYWESILCNVNYLDENRISIILTEEQNVIVSIQAI